MELNNKHKLIIFLFLFKCIGSSNILYIDPIPSPSHHLWNRVFALGLASKGHNVTMLTHEMEKTPAPKNFTIITMEGIFDLLFKEGFDLEKASLGSIPYAITSLYDYGIFGCRYDYNTLGLQSLLNYPVDYTFDLIIIDVTIGRYLYPLVARFHNPPVLAVTPFLLSSTLSSTFGNYLQTSHVPYFATTYTNKMSLLERIYNLVWTYYDIIYKKFVFIPKENAMIKEKFKNLQFSIDEIERNVSLLLCNIDPITDYPMSLPPNIIPVGVLHAKPGKPLTEDLQKVMDRATEGVILFSLGTNLKSDSLDLTTRTALLRAFAKLRQLVIWKFESDNIELPKNVIVRKWLPQNDILSHPNTKLFINHGGALSSQEAIYHAVPTIGIPFFYDQQQNVKKMVEKGVTIYLDKNNLTSENVYNAITTALDKPRDIIKKMSKLLRDQPMTALERAIFWAEYLIRHGSAEHLVPASRDLFAYQTAYVDVLVVTLLGLIVIYSSTQLLLAYLKLSVLSKALNENKIVK